MGPRRCWWQVAADGTADRRWQRLSDVLLLSGAPGSSADILPSLGLLPHAVRRAPAEAAAATGGPPAEVMLIDARRDLMHAKGLVRELREAGLDVPILAVVAEGGWAAVTADWGADDVILHTAGPGEVDARLRLAIGRRAIGGPAAAEEIRSGDLVIDEASYQARLRGRTLDLTFKEFELLKFLAQHPARVFTRSQLLQEVWGYDYFGGTRTVDVHVRRLRAKLGVEYESLIGTVRNVGYRFVPSPGKAEGRGQPPGAATPPGYAPDEQVADEHARDEDARNGSAGPRPASRAEPARAGPAPAGGDSRPDGAGRRRSGPASPDPRREVIRATAIQ
jgi:DNA-binding response OmpR family regulator